MNDYGTSYLSVNAKETTILSVEKLGASVTFQLATYEYKSALRQLLELYKYDFTEYDPEDVNESGLYEYRDLDAYWNEPGHFPFLLRVDGKLAGFALIRRFVIDLASDTYGHEMVEFFVMKKYRKSGLGTLAADWLFRQFSGSWKLGIMEENKLALRFWRHAIASCVAASHYAEGQEVDWEGPVLQFEIKP
ncbi:GNAT family N-acetyltransferase [Saccharibacillus sp. JS10]|uniref:GNAT family N-acetyltransferase n=1 Tax=Saccharibacillus sp. JS10 TaxID=2950552 RepID=UPI00210A9D1F|nr:GNAT family N-acetyltransferase [Saccharibacillus sp. JS10]MCQ4087702.1 GNAT family N-acetyltransferase [Saccharibacillus sp. JS10]